ncbi:dimethylargininase [Fodinicola feengrottensis]|uniref:dimethylargininase n=1 Tax=Fodinicola feengrottensis TaxID=435914 RepID=UPI0036F26240
MSPAVGYQPAAVPARVATPRTYLMCRPTYFTVTYAINAWMDPAIGVDTELAIAQWDQLRRTYELLGHTVHLLPERPGLPDMVFAANGGFSVGGVFYGARFTFPQRADDERPAHLDWYERHGWPAVRPGTFTNEGEGDFTYLPGPDLVLAGYGFRTDRRAHTEAAAVLGREVVSLELVDPRFYHLDTALFVLDDETICYYPAAFGAQSQDLLARRFPNALVATEADALAFGLNAVSDGRHVVLSASAIDLIDRLAGLGYQPVPVADSELRKAGGSAKCCTAELRR